MAISFPGAKNYKRNNGYSPTADIKTPFPAPMHFYSLEGNKDTLLIPTVKVGDFVKAGEKIADIERFNILPVHSSVSGKVVSVSDNVIAVESDMMFTQAPPFTPHKDISALTSIELLWILREMGVCEVRTGTPVHVLLSPEKTPDCVIVCCFDSDPYVSSPQMMTRNNVEKILKGLDIVMGILGVDKAFIGVENDAKENLSDIKYHLRYNEDITFVSLKPRYPQSDNRFLIKTLTGKSESKIKPVVLSSETLYNIASVFEYGHPVTHKMVTVSGDDILPANNFYAPIGIPFSSLLGDSGYTGPEYVFDGGVVRGTKVIDMDTPVTRTTKAIVAFNTASNIPKYRKELI